MSQISKVSEPLRKLTEKNVMLTWDCSQEEAFQAIKNMINSAFLLKYYDEAIEITIQCDAKGPVWEQLCYLLTAAWLAQLGERRSAEREVVGSNPGQTNTQGLKITEEKVLPLQ